MPVFVLNRRQTDKFTLSLRVEILRLLDMLVKLPQKDVLFRLIWFAV